MAESHCCVPKTITTLLISCKNEILPLVATWMDIESTVLIEVRERQLLMVSHIHGA